MKKGKEKKYAHTNININEGANNLELKVMMSNEEQEKIMSDERRNRTFGWIE